MDNDSYLNKQSQDRVDKAKESIHAASNDNRAPPRSSDESSAAQSPVLDTCVSVPARQESSCLHQYKKREEHANEMQSSDHGQDEAPTANLAMADGIGGAPVVCSLDP
jgi:hypothetical protein